MRQLRTISIRPVWDTRQAKDRRRIIKSSQRDARLEIWERQCHLRRLIRYPVETRLCYMVSPGQIHLSCSVACWAAAWVSCGVRVNMRSAKRPSVAERNRLWENSSIPSNWGVQRSSNLGVHQILNTCSVHRGRSVSENLSLALPLSLAVLCQCEPARAYLWDHNDISWRWCKTRMGRGLKICLLCMFTWTGHYCFNGRNVCVGI